MLPSICILSSCIKNNLEDNFYVENEEIIKKSNEVKNIHREGLDFVIYEINHVSTNDKIENLNRDI